MWCNILPEKDSMKKLVIELFKCVGTEIEKASIIENESDLENILKDDDNVDFVWFNCGDRMKDPVWFFWRLVKGKKLNHECKVVFTGIDKVVSVFSDLESTYKSVRFGSLCLLTFSATCAPRAMPSQRGMFTK